MHDSFIERLRGQAQRSDSFGAGFLGRRMLQGIGVSLFVLAVLGVGCKGSKDPSSGDLSTEAMITATPNPVPVKTGKGTTQINWSTGDGSKGEIYMSANGKPEQLFAGLAPRGSQEAAWIHRGSVYEFRLYAGKEHAKVLASVAVTTRDP